MSKLHPIQTKFWAALLIPLYLLTQVLTPDVAQAAGRSVGTSSIETAAFQTWQPLPKHGSITEKVFAPHSRGTLIHIQDAHAVLDAQQNIQNLLDELKSQFGASDIYLEGGAGKLDPERQDFHFRIGAAGVVLRRSGQCHPLHFLVSAL